jgi:hypothetical protein
MLAGGRLVKNGWIGLDLFYDWSRPRGPRYQHQFSSRSRDDGKQPPRTGQFASESRPPHSAVERLQPRDRPPDQHPLDLTALEDRGLRGIFRRSAAFGTPWYQHGSNTPRSRLTTVSAPLSAGGRQVHTRYNGSLTCTYSSGCPWASGGARTGRTRAESGGTQHKRWLGRVVPTRRRHRAGQGPARGCAATASAKIVHSSLCAVRLHELVAGKRVTPVDLIVTYGEEGRATPCVCQPARPCQEEPFHPVGSLRRNWVAHLTACPVTGRIRVPPRSLPCSGLPAGRAASPPRHPRARRTPRPSECLLALPLSKHLQPARRDQAASTNTAACHETTSAIRLTAPSPPGCRALSCIMTRHRQGSLWRLAFPVTKPWR